MGYFAVRSPIFNAFIIIPLTYSGISGNGTPELLPLSCLCTAQRMRSCSVSYALPSRKACPRLPSGNVWHHIGMHLRSTPDFCNTVFSFLYIPHQPPDSHGSALYALNTDPFPKAASEYLYQTNENHPHDNS